VADELQRRGDSEARTAVISVLIVDDDPLLRLALAQGLRRLQVEVSVAESVAEATQRLDEGPVDVVVTDLCLADGSDGIEMLARVRERSPATRTILMSGFATARDYENAMSLGAVMVLCKPFTVTDLHAAVRRAAESSQGFHGSFHGMSLVDLLQMLHLARRDSTIDVDGGGPRAQIHMEKGHIVHATCGERIGEEAFRCVMRARGGSFRTGPLALDVPHSIARSFDTLLLDTLRTLDEQERAGGRRSELSLSQFPDDPFGVEAVAVPRPSLVPAEAEAHPAQSSALASAPGVWSAARNALGSASGQAIAVAFERKAAGHLRLSEGSEDDRYVEPLVQIADALCRVAACEHVVASCVGDGFGVGIVSAPNEDLTIGVVDALSSSSAAMLFRSLVSTTARCVLER
jgi:CheY-like chemotaxis protein